MPPEETTMSEPSSRRDFLKTTAALPLAAGVYAAGVETIRVGLIGCGGRGTEAAEQAMAADPGVRLVAMADVVPARIREKREILRTKGPKQVAVDDDHCFAGFDAYKHVIESSDVVLI